MTRFEVQLARDQPVRWVAWRDFPTLADAQAAVRLTIARHERVRIVTIHDDSGDAAQPEGN